MSNTLFKQVRERVVLPPPPPPPPPPKRRLVRKTGTRPKYREYVTVTVLGMAGDKVLGNVTQVRERDGSESYDYYEWEIVESPVPPPLPPVVTPIPPRWDATARSGLAVTAPMAVEWVVSPGNADIVVGLSSYLGSPPVPDGSDATKDAAKAAGLLASVLHGFRVVGSSAYVHSAPPPEFGAVVLEQRHPYRTIQSGSICRVECTRGVVRYLVDDELVATGPSYVHEGQAVYLRAALFATTDIVDDPSIEKLLPSVGIGGAVIGPLTAMGSVGKFGQGRAMFGLWANGPRRMGVHATLPPLWARGGRGGGTASLQLAPLEAWGWAMPGNSGDASLLLAPLTAKGGDYADGAAMLGMFAFGRGAEIPPQVNPLMGFDSLIAASIDPRPHGGLYGDVGIGCSFTVEHARAVRLRTTLGLRGTAKASRLWPARFDTTLGLAGNMRAARVLDVALVAGLGMKMPTVGLLILTAELDTELGMAAHTDTQRMLDGVLRTALGVGVDMDAQGLYHATLRAVLGLGLLGTRGEDDYLVWSVEQGGASAAYSGFAFNSFARVGGRIFAASDEGLYELGGTDDDGEPIAAWVDLGKRNFGSTLLKGISNAYLTASSDAKLTVRVTTPEGRSYTYRARRADEAMQAQRVDFGRGLRATYLNLELMNEGGGDFDLERLEFIVNESTRRI